MLLFANGAASFERSFLLCNDHFFPNTILSSLYKKARLKQISVRHDNSIFNVFSVDSYTRRKNKVAQVAANDLIDMHSFSASFKLTPIPRDFIRDVQFIFILTPNFFRTLELWFIMKLQTCIFTTNNRHPMYFRFLSNIPIIWLSFNRLKTLQLSFFHLWHPVFYL